MRGLICATPRCGSTALIQSLGVRGAAEYPVGDPVAMVHWAQMPATADRYVYLYRADQIAQAISWAVAAATGRFHSIQEPGDLSPRFDRASVEHGLRGIADQDASWRKWLADKPTLLLCYEDDLNGKFSEAAGRVLEWFGVRGEPCEPTLRPVDADIKSHWRRAWR